MSRAAPIEILIGVLLYTSCATVRLPAGTEGVIRPWSDCATMEGVDEGVGVAGLVRTFDGQPIPGAQIRLADGSLRVSSFGKWRPWLDDDVESNAGRSKADGSFRIPRERYDAVEGVVVVNAFSRGYRAASASWVGKDRMCIEFVLAADESRPDSMRER